MTEPRLLLGGGRLAALREAIAGSHTAQFTRLLDQCAYYAAETPPAEHPEASITYFGPASAGFALAHRLTDQEQYLDQARRWIAGAVAFPHWGRAHLPDHDLDAGWLLHGLALAYDWLGERLPEPERAALRDKLILQGQRMHDFAAETEGGWWSSSYWQNHNWICHAGLLAAGYALRPEHPPARAWVDRAVANFRTVAGALPADGSSCEGVVYWRYGVPWLAVAFDLITDQDGEDLFGACDYLRHTFAYRMHQSAPGWEYIVDHGDCHDRRSGHSLALYHKLAARYRIAQAQWLAERVRERFLGREWHESGVKPGVRAEGYLELLWYDPTVPAEDPGQAPTSAYFPDLGLVCARTGWDADAVALSFKCAPGGGHTAWEASHRARAERGWDILNAGHHHPDANAFVLIGHGAHLAVEDGYANQKLTAGHSVVLVDGRGYAGEGRYHVYRDLPAHHRAHTHSVVSEAGWTHAVGEAAAMYPDELGVTRASRRLLFAPGGSLLLVDELAATAARTWTWLLHTDRPARPLPDGRALVRTGTGALAVRTLPAEVTDGAVPPDDHPRDDPDGRDNLGDPGGGRAWPFTRSTTEITANPTASTPSLALARTLHTLGRASGPGHRARFVTLLLPGSALTDTPGDAARREHTAAGPAGPAVERITWRHAGHQHTVTLSKGGVRATSRPAGPDPATDPAARTLHVPPGPGR